jgi:hypothetical protein
MIWRRRCRCNGSARKRNRWSRSSGITHQHADQASERSVALLEGGRWAYAAKPFGNGADARGHCRTAGCRKEAVEKPPNFLLPRPCAGAFFCRASLVRRGQTVKREKEVRPPCRPAWGTIVPQKDLWITFFFSAPEHISKKSRRHAMFRATKVKSLHIKSSTRIKTDRARASGLTW